MLFYLCYSNTISSVNFSDFEISVLKAFNFSIGLQYSQTYISKLAGYHHTLL